MKKAKSRIRKDVPENRCLKMILFKAYTFFYLSTIDWLIAGSGRETKSKRLQKWAAVPFFVEEVRTVNIRTELCKVGGFIINCTPDTWCSLWPDRWFRIHVETRNKYTLKFNIFLVLLQGSLSMAHANRRPYLLAFYAEESNFKPSA
jgi:hypothetical protein